VLQKVSEEDISQFNEKFITYCENHLNNKNAYKSNYLWEFYSNHLVYDCIINKNYTSKEKIFIKATDQEFISNQIKILSDMQYSNLLMFNALKAEIFFSKTDYSIFTKNIENLFEFRCSYLESNLEILKYKLEDFIISRDFNLLDEILRGIEGIVDNKVKSLFCLKILIISAANEIDIKKYCSLIIDFLKFEYSLLFEKEEEIVISAVLIDYAEKISLSNELINYITCRKTEEELKNMSPTKIVFEDMFFRNNIERIKQIKVDYAKQKDALSSLDNVLKNTINIKSRNSFDYAVYGRNYDLIPHYLLKENLYPEIIKETKKAENFLFELIENFRFIELKYLLESFNSFDKINKTSLLVWLLMKNQSDVLINYSLKIIIIDFLNDYLDYVNLNESKTRIKPIIDYVLNKINNYSLNIGYEGYEFLSERLEIILSQINESELYEKFNSIIKENKLSKKPIIPNSVRLKSLISRTGVSPSLRQSVRIQTTTNLYSNVKIEAYMEEIESTYYDFMELLISNKNNDKNLQNYIQNIKNPYWRILAIIDTIQNKENYLDKIVMIGNLILNSDFGFENSAKKAELIIEVLCLDFEFGQKHDFIDHYFNLTRLSSLKENVLKCANNLIYFYDTEFIQKVLKINLNYSSSYINFSERCLSAYFKNIEDVELDHENFLLILIFENQQLLNKYNNIRKEDIKGNIQFFYSLATNNLDNKNYKRAIYYLNRCLNKCLISYERNFSNAAIFYNNIGNAYFNLQDYTSALSYFIKCLQLEKMNFGETRPIIVTFYKDIANTYGQLNNNLEKIKYLERVLEVHNTSNVLEKSELATTYFSIGEALEDEKDFNKAINYFEKSLKIYSENPVEHYSELATLYFYIGNLLMAKSDLHRAAKFYQKGLEIKMKLSPEKSLSEIFNEIGGGVPFTIAESYFVKNDLENALVYYVHSANSRKQRLGVDDERTKVVVSHAKEISERLNQIDNLPDWIKNS
jgi:tetratricopeptide (TPR) repeat protein